jgi:uncharacterized protein with GYD domain
MSDPPGREAGGRRRIAMPRYLNLFSYTPEALASLTKNPQDRSVAVRESSEARGGKLLAFYHMGGGVEYHGFTITEEPDDETAEASGWAVEAAGHIKTFRSFQIFTPEEMMESLRKAGGETLRPPTSGDGS